MQTRLTERYTEMHTYVWTDTRSGSHEHIHGWTRTYWTHIYADTYKLRRRNAQRKTKMHRDVQALPVTLMSQLFK